MGGKLRVDPARLRTAAEAQAEVGAFVSGMSTGRAITNAVGSGAGLLSESACQFAATTFDAAAGTVHEELTAHSTNLSAAADRYHRTDEDFARRLRTIAE